MKKLSLFLVAFVAFTFFSCSSDNEPVDPVLAGQTGNGGNSGGSVLFKADFNGSTWNATQAMAEIGGNYISIAGINNSGDNFAFMIDANQTGTYPANENLLTYNPVSGDGYGYWSVNNNNPSDNTGSITITNINTANKTISGTFQFTGYWSDMDNTSVTPIEFTNGIFQNVPYTGYTDPGADSFFAKVDGVEFVDTDILVATVNNVIGVGAENAASQSMTVGMNDDLTPGTYTITGNVSTDVVQANYTPVSGGSSIQASSGSVTITSITADRVAGMFSFTVIDGGTTYSVTEGSFDVEY